MKEVIKSSIQKIAQLILCMIISLDILISILQWVVQQMNLLKIKLTLKVSQM